MRVWWRGKNGSHHQAKIPDATVIGRLAVAFVYFPELGLKCGSSAVTPWVEWRVGLSKFQTHNSTWTFQFQQLSTDCQLTVNISAASTSVTVISRIPASRHCVPLHLESLELRYVTMEILPNSRPFQCNNLGNAALQPHQRESRVRVVISVTTSMSTMRHPETDSSSS